MSNLYRSRITGTVLFGVRPFFLFVALLGLSAGPVLAADNQDKLSPKERCESDKLLAASKYTECLVKEIAHALVKGTEPSESAIMLCNNLFDQAFYRAEADGSCRTAGGPATIRIPILDRAGTLEKDLADSPGCPSGNLSIIDGEYATCKVSTTASGIDIAAIASQLSAQNLPVNEDTTLWIQAWGAKGGAGSESNGGQGGAAGYAQTITTVNKFINDFGTTEIHYYLGNNGTYLNGTGGAGGAATLVTTADVATTPSLPTTVLIAGGGGGGGAGRGPKSDVCNGLDDVLGAYGGQGGIAIASINAIALAAGDQGGYRRHPGDQAWSGSGGGGDLNGTGGISGGNNSADGASGYACLGGLGGAMSGNLVGFFNLSVPTITTGGGHGGSPGDGAPGGGGGGGLGAGGGGSEGDGGTDCVSGGGGGGGSIAVQSEVQCTAAPTSPPANPNGGEQGFVQIVFDLGACSGS